MHALDSDPIFLAMDILQTVLIVIHALAASFVILFGPVNVLRPRKDARHRLLGRIYAAMMYFVCVSGMFIYTDGAFTIFHFLAIVNLASVTIGILAIRRRNVRLHRGMMIGSWLGTAIAGAFAVLIPGRRIPTLAVEDPALLWGIIAAIVLAATITAALVLRAPARAGRAPATAASPAAPAEGPVSAR